MSDEPVSDLDLVRWSEALAGIARTGLAFTDSLYERERFEEILKVAADIRVAADHDEGRFDADQVVAGWMDSVGEGVAGYVTPKVAVGAIVGNERGELLLIQRGDSGVWLYPTGWADVGYSAAEVVVKEVAEETGHRGGAGPAGRGVRRAASRCSGAARSTPWCSIAGRSAEHSARTRSRRSAVGWFAEDALPEPLAGGGRWQDLAFSAIRGETFEVVFDSPRPSTWRS